MNGITAKLTGSVTAAPEVHQTPGGLAWVRFAVSADTEQDSETTTSFVRVTVSGDLVADLAPRLVAGARVFCRRRLTLRSWKTDSGERKAGLSLAARKVEIIRERVHLREGCAPHEIENVINECLYDPWFRSLNLEGARKASH
jgi:single-stranded DNA-binding protein